MPKQHEVKQGETLPEIARRYGFTKWEVVRDHPDNAELFETRREGVLYPGDVVVIPDFDTKTDAAGTRAKHEYVIPKPRRWLRLRLLDGANEPLKNYAYELVLAKRGKAEQQEGTTDGDGIIHVDLPLDITRAAVAVTTPDEPAPLDGSGPVLARKTRYERKMRVGHLDPVTHLTGVHARLQNLGYFFGEISETYTHKTRLAVYKFKLDWVDGAADKAEKGELDGKLDDDTLAKLVEVHDNLVKSGLSFADSVPKPIPRGRESSQRVDSHLVAPVVEESDATFNTLRLSPPPDLVFDAHMHIQSNSCAPMPLVWGIVPMGAVDGQPRRRLDWLARSWLFTQLKGEFGTVGTQSTNAIGDIAAARNKKTFVDERSFPRTNAGEVRLTPMIVLEMDMEMAHLDGYLGEPIYYPVAQRKERSYTEYVSTGMGMGMGMPVAVESWEALGPAIPRHVDASTGAPYTAAEKAQAEAARDAAAQQAGKKMRTVTFAERNGVAGEFYYFISYDMDTWEDTNEAQKWKVEFVDDEEYDLYEGFGEQQERTLMAAVKNPWSYMPLFHYDPRRWQLAPGASGRGVAEAWDKPFDKVATKSHVGPYIGFKMYTPLGYKPSDYEKWLPQMASYFQRCQAEEIPILTHCTPGGMYTNERDLYYEVASDAVKRTLQTSKGKDPKRKARIRWFSDTHVSPDAWRPVLTRYPKLKLCLAHFVGDDWEDWRGSIRRNMATRWAMGHRDPSVWWNESGTGPWVKSIIKLIEDFENVYTDISYFDVEKHEEAFTWLMKAYPYLKRRINFGTDWYMVENDIKGYDKYCRKMKGAIDRVNAAVFPDDPIPLWERFTRDNPLRCYRLLDSAENWVAGLKESNARISRKARQMNIEWRKSEYDDELTRGLSQFLRVNHLDPS
ncbi:hypothetical protein PPSIR1_13065 [Plesiocystis pacifica SIR-1]|uniref:Uncharacterized protein n=1 Tax=Plesiocystis pacifica SIR-1 TaxID=391625 RepID=A6GAW0_9BACT|nr:LysM peptidoglycan-binding domain-containing protein [Plesiocystis pacifica]EDM76945.1 hypothetical protein PPSIR1_13065 [Plesiocystis pacifica SIR-1]